MCEKIEAYANERRKENAKIYSAICMESLNGMSKEDILKKSCMNLLFLRMRQKSIIQNCSKTSNKRKNK